MIAYILIKLIYDSGSVQNFALHVLMHVLSLQHQDLNARQIRNVLSTLHVYKKNARIHVSQSLVASKRNAKSKTIVLSVSVCMDTKAIHILSVRNPVVRVIQNAHYSMPV